MNSLLLVGAVIGATQIIKEVFPGKISGILTIVIAATLGVVAGLFGVDGLNIGTGLLVAIGAIGTVTVADKIMTPSVSVTAPAKKVAKS